MVQLCSAARSTFFPSSPMLYAHLRIRRQEELRGERPQVFGAFVLLKKCMKTRPTTMMARIATAGEMNFNSIIVKDQLQTIDATSSARRPLSAFPVSLMRAALNYTHIDMSKPLPLSHPGPANAVSSVLPTLTTSYLVSVCYNQLSRRTWPLRQIALSRTGSVALVTYSL